MSQETVLGILLALLAFTFAGLAGLAVWQLCVNITAYVAAVNRANDQKHPEKFDPEIYGTPGYISARHASSTRVSHPPRTPALASPDPEEIVPIEQIEAVPAHFAPAKSEPRSGVMGLTMLGMGASMPPTRNPRLPAPPPRRGTQLGLGEPQAPRIAKLTPPSAEPKPARVRPRRVRLLHQAGGRSWAWELRLLSTEEPSSAWGFRRSPSRLREPRRPHRPRAQRPRP